MAAEIERKFLVKRECLPILPLPCSIQQGYFTQSGPAIRVSIKGFRDEVSSKVCFKGEGVMIGRRGGPHGGALYREEFEYEIPPSDAWELLRMAPARVLKFRYYIDGGWEVDHIPVLDLWLAEFEHAPGKKFPVAPPAWLGEEVTGRPEYGMQMLAVAATSAVKLVKEDE